MGERQLIKVNRGLCLLPAGVCFRTGADKFSAKGYNTHVNPRQWQGNGTSQRLAGLLLKIAAREENIGLS
jgi:hypothetical protein